MRDGFLSIILLIVVIVIIAMFMFHEKRKTDKIKKAIERYNALIEEKKSESCDFREEELLRIRSRIRRQLSFDKKSFPRGTKYYHQEMRDFIIKFEVQTRKDQKINVDDYFRIYDFLHLEM